MRVHSSSTSVASLDSLAVGWHRVPGGLCRALRLASTVEDQEGVVQVSARERETLTKRQEMLNTGTTKLLCAEECSPERLCTV